MTPYDVALAELEEAERDAARVKSVESIRRVIAARARASAVFRARGSQIVAPRAWIGNRAP
jgi:hypothetical protein